METQTAPAAITLARREHILNTKMNYSDGGIQTRREYITRKISEGAKITVVTVEDETAIRRISAQIDSLRRQGEPSGNPLWGPTAKYYRLKSELESGPNKEEYRLNYSNNSFSVITKTEYEFGLSL